MKRLTDLEIESVHLVDLPAIKEKFYIVKRGEGRDMADEKKPVATDVDAGELDAMLSDIVAKALASEVVNALRGALKILAKYDQQLPEEGKKALEVLARLAGYGTPDYGYAKPQKSEGKEDVQKVGAAISKERREKIGAVIASLRSLADELQKMLDEAMPRTDKDEVAVVTPEELAGLKKSLDELAQAIPTEESLQALVEKVLGGVEVD